MSKSAEKPRRRPFQFSLRTLLLLVTLAALLAVAWRWYVEPYRQQQQVMQLVKELGGSCQTIEAAGWMKRMFGSDLQNVIQVDLADCDEPEKYLDQVASLPALRKLIVGGPAITDNLLSRLSRLTRLQKLVLDCTDVSDEGLMALREAMPKVVVSRSAQRALTYAKEKGISVEETSKSTRPQDMRNGLTSPPMGAGYDVALGGNLFGSQRSNEDLAILRRMPNVRGLYIGGESLTDAGMEHVVAMKTLDAVRINGTNVSDQGLQELVKLPKLEWLSLGFMSEPKITGSGIANLHASPALRRVALDGMHVSQLHLTVGFDALEYLSCAGDFKDLRIKGLRKLKELYVDDYKWKLERVDFHDLPELRKVSIHSDPLAPKLQVSLDRLEKVEHLSLRLALNDADCEPLKGAPNVRSLSIASTKMTSRGLSYFSRFAKLEELTIDFVPRLPDLPGTRCRDEDLKHLSELRELRILHLDRASFDGSGLRYVGTLPKLTELSLSSNHVTDDALAHLQKAASLRRLDLSGNEAITDSGLAYLEGLTSLEELEISWTRVTHAGVARLLPKLQRIRKLGLNGIQITDDTAQVLMNLPQLEELDVSNTPIADTAVHFLTLSPSLKLVSAHNTNLSEDGLAHLKQLRNRHLPSESKE